MYIYYYAYTHICVYAYTYVYICKYTCQYMNTHTHTHTHQKHTHDLHVKHLGENEFGKIRWNQIKQKKWQIKSFRSNRESSALYSSTDLAKCCRGKKKNGARRGGKKNKNMQTAQSWRLNTLSNFWSGESSVRGGKEWGGKKGEMGKTTRTTQFVRAQHLIQLLTERNVAIFSLRFLVAPFAHHWERLVE